MKKEMIFTLLLLVGVFGFGQDLPDDYLSAAFHKERRAAFREMMPANTVAVLFANPVRNRSNDVSYIYHQDPDFYYLTGYREPNAVLLIFSEDQIDENGKPYNESLYVQKRDALKEQWDGKRLGVEGAKEALGFKKAYQGSEFLSLELDFKKFDKVLFFDFKNDYRDTGQSANLFNLIKAFKEKTNYPSDYNATKQQLYGLIATANADNSRAITETLRKYIRSNDNLKDDELLMAFASANSDVLRTEIKERVNLMLKSNNLDSAVITEIMKVMRETKTPEELKLLKKAVEISAVGQIEVMKAMHPKMSEKEIQGIHEFVYKKYGSEYEGYPSIVGAGNNGCILHYIENAKTKLGKDLVLMDLGAEYHGYTADVTRTIPANGKFTKEQKLIYDIVYDAQEAGIAASQVGAPFYAPEKAARTVVEKRLIALGIARDKKEARIYFPHSTTHYLGLDVHDKGTRQNFKPNTVITVEPGIYIPDGSKCDPKWWGIAVRIEDDILITEDGPVNLSALAPRTTEAIEAVMKEDSPLDDFVLPALD